jgi:hypothetical protein
MANLLTSTQVRALVNKLGAGEAAAQTIVGATNASPSVVNVTGHGYVVGDVLLISGTTGNTNLNGVRVVATTPDADHYTATDLFTGSAVNGNSATGGSPVCHRIAQLLTPGDLEDLMTTLERMSFSPRGEDAQRSLENSIKTIVGV